MKYIRTKDGRIVDVSNIILQDELTIEDIKDVSKETSLVAYYEGIEIVKYADTIEELIDYVSFINVYGNRVFVELKDEEFYTKEETLAIYKRAFLTKHIKDYKGCILTDKGLIYVAKMNEKGEFELL